MHVAAQFSAQGAINRPYWRNALRRHIFLWPLP